MAGSRGAQPPSHENAGRRASSPALDERLAAMLASSAAGEQAGFETWSAQVPKSEHSADECEDAFEARGNALAVSDGASAFIHSGLWARLLVRHFAETSSPPLPSCGLSSLADEWRAQAAGTGEGGDWFAGEKLRRGAAATFLGLLLGRKWVALATGDTCLMLVRDDEPVFSFPVCRSGDFGSAPPLVYTAGVLRTAAGKPATMQALGGDCRPGDVFVLATDAVASWLVSSAEAGRRPWRALVAHPSPESFAEFVRGLRTRGKMEDDDATVVVAEVHG